MNKRLLQTVIGLVWFFLVAFCITKIFFGEYFVAVVTNDKLIMVGHFIDTHPAVTFLVNVLVGFFGAHFYYCACIQVWRLPESKYCIVFCHVLIAAFVSVFNAFIGTLLDFAAMIIIPILFNAKFKQIITIFCLHHLSAALSLFIRSEPLYLASTDYATTFILLFDAYLCIILYYLYSNLYKEETIWEFLFSRFSVIKRKMSLKRHSKR